MSEILRELLTNLVYAGIVAFIPVIIITIRKISVVIIQHLEIKSDNELVNQVVAEIVTFAEEAVTYTMQTYVDSLKKNGEFTKEAQEIAFNRALDTAKQFISEESAELFESVYGNLDEYLEVVIESKVKELKMISSN